MEQHDRRAARHLRRRRIEVAGLDRDLLVVRVRHALVARQLPERVAVAGLFETLRWAQPRRRVVDRHDYAVARLAGHAHPLAIRRKELHALRTDDAAADRDEATAVLRAERGQGRRQIGPRSVPVAGHAAHASVHKLLHNVASTHALATTQYEACPLARVEHVGGESVEAEQTWAWLVGDHAA